MESYTAIKQNQLLLYAATWMNHKIIMLSELKKPDLEEFMLYDSIYMKFKNNSLIVIGFRVVVT